MFSPSILMASDLSARWRVTLVRTPLNGCPGDGFVQARKCYQNVNGRAKWRRFAKVSADQCGDEIQLEKADQPPIQSSDDDQYASDYTKFFHC
jgi:hypothetical protein